MLARKIKRSGYFWLTMETYCCQFVQKCLDCQVHGDFIHVSPLELHALTSPWLFSVWVWTCIFHVCPHLIDETHFYLVKEIVLEKSELPLILFLF